MRRSRHIAFVVAAALLLAGCLDPTTGRPPPVDQAVPPYSSAIRTVTRAQLGESWRSGCPVAVANLREVRVKYWGYDGAVHAGGLIVNRSVAEDVAAAFGELYDGRFQIRRIHPVTVYGADDDRSMAANNTSAFNCRPVTGGSTWSEHSYGTAVDINPVQNPYVTSSGTVLPPGGKPWTNRSVNVPGMIRPGGVVLRAFGDIGWGWGGDWRSLKDYQHLSLSGR